MTTQEFADSIAGKWIGVDLDGTLAYDGPGASIRAIGDPIPAMVKRVRDWLQHGIEVRIVTARASRSPDAMYQKPLVREWCITHLGQDLPVTNGKDYQMHELWDDRAVQVVRNTGERVGQENPRALGATEGDTPEKALRDLLQIVLELDIECDQGLDHKFTWASGEYSTVSCEQSFGAFKREWTERLHRLTDIQEASHASA